VAASDHDASRRALIRLIRSPSFKDGSLCLQSDKTPEPRKPQRTLRGAAATPALA
jgi:hypothetical protein